MKKIIDGKRYDTATAEQVASWDNGLGSGDFNNCSEEIYLTKSGNWFIHGEGGALTGYSESCGNNSTCGGEDIRPVTTAEAREWLEGHDEIEALEKYFAKEIEDA